MLDAVRLDDVGQAVQRWDSYDAHRGRWGAVGPLDVRPQGPVPGGDLVPHILEQEGNLLEDIGPPAAAALPTLLAAMDDPHVDPRRRATEALGTVGSGCGAEGQADLCVALAGMLADREQEVRRNAAYSLARLGPAVQAGTPAESTVVDALRLGMDDPYHYVRGLSVLALERMGTPAALGSALGHLQTMRFD